MHACGRSFFNPDDGKQPKTFGLNPFNFTIFNFFNFFSLVFEIHFIERTLWTKHFSCPLFVSHHLRYLFLYLFENES